MKHTTIIILFTAVFFPFLALGSGFRIPGQSIEAIGLAGAHIASTPGPDSSYFNPANMSFLHDAYQTDLSLTLLHLPAIKYSDNRSSLLNGSSEKETFFLPQFHLASKDYQGFRFGFSLTYPFGLAKSWSQVFPQMTAQEFSLSVIESNPTFSYTISNMLRIGGGIRVVYGSGKVKNRVENPPAVQIAPLSTLTIDLDGNSWELGYNLALTVQASDSLTFATTYRSEVSLELDGDAFLQAWLGQNPISSYKGAGAVEISLPAVWSLATAYSFENFTVELVWDRTFWSSFKELDFQYADSLLGTPFEGFDQTITKNWKDSDALRLGLSIDWTAKWKSTFGFAIDNTPVPEATLGFDLPDSDAFIYSAGVFYRCNDEFNLGITYMYHHTKTRSVQNTGTAGLPGIDGTFTDGGAHVVSLGMVYKF